MKVFLTFVVAICVILLFGCQEYHKSDRAVVMDTTFTGRQVAKSLYGKGSYVGSSSNIRMGDTVWVYIAASFNGEKFIEFKREGRDSVL